MLHFEASVSGRGDCRGGYKWKRRLPASSFGAVIRTTTAGGGDSVADQILNNTCEYTIYDMLVWHHKGCLTRPQLLK